MSEPDLDTYALRSADLAEVAAPDLPWQPDVLQRDCVAAQKRVDQRLREVLQTFAIPSVAVNGVGAQRLACAMAAIGHLQEVAR